MVLEKAKMSVNLGCYPPLSPAHQEMIDRIMGRRKAKTMTEQNKEASFLKKKALAAKCDKKNKFKLLCTIYNVGDCMETYENPTNKNQLLYKLTVIFPEKEEIEVLMKNYHIILPVKQCVYMNEPWVEFYYGFISQTQAKLFTIITENGIYKVSRGYLMGQMTSKSGTRGYSTPCMLSERSLKDIVAKEKAWAEFQQDKDSDAFPDYCC